MRNSRAYTESGSPRQKQPGQSPSKTVMKSKDQSIRAIRSLLDPVRRHREPLIERLRNLSGGVVAGFAKDLALLSETMSKTHWVDDENQSIRRCRELLPTLAHPVDMLSVEDKESLLREESLKKQHPSFLPLLNKITEMNQLREQLNKIYPTMSNELFAVVRNYEQFIITLCNTKIELRVHLLESASVISGDGIDLLSVLADLGLNLFCRNRLGMVHKTNPYGNHAVTLYDGVFYKPNPMPDETLDGLYICPGDEFRAVAMLQLIAGEYNVAAPTSFIKARNVQKFNAENKPNGFLSGTIQAGLAIDGISGLDLLLIHSKAKLISQQTQHHEQCSIYTAYVNLDLKLERLFESYPILRVWYHRELPRKLVAEKEQIHKEILPIIIACIGQFPEIENNQNCKDYASLIRGNPIVQSNVIDRWLGSIPLKVIIQFLALLPDLLPAINVFTLEDTIVFVYLMRHLPRMFPSLIPEEISNELPNYLSRIDVDHFCVTVVAHLMLKPNDGKPDNFIAQLELNEEKSKVVRIRFIGIDNNGFKPFAFTSRHIKVGKETEEQHINKIECFFFLLDTMETKITQKLKDWLLSRTALEWTLDYAKLVYDYCERIQQLRDQKILSDTDLKYQGRPILDIPPKFYLFEFVRFYEEWVIFLDFLRDSATLPSLNTIFRTLHPVVFELYKVCKQRKGDITLAYGDVHRSGNVERELKDLDATLKMRIFETLSRNSISSVVDKEGPTATCTEALLSFLDVICKKKLIDSDFQSFLNRVGVHFPKLHFLTNQDAKWKVNRLFESARYALPGMAELLLFHGAKVGTVDEAGRSLLHLLFERAHLHPHHQVLETLDCYLAREMIDLNRADLRGFFPILLAVKSLDDELAVDVLERFGQKDVWLDQVDQESGQTALDMAMSKGKANSVCALIRLGAGARIISEIASQFFSQHNDPAFMQFYNTLRERSPEFHYFESLRNLRSAESGLIHQNRILRCNNNGQVEEIAFSTELQSMLFNMGRNGKDSDKDQAKTCGLVITDGESRIVAVQNPTSFGREVVTATLRKRLFGYCTSHAELFKCVTSSGESYPLLLSSDCSGDDLMSLLRRDAGGEELAKVLLQVLDPQTTWELILVTILTFPALTDTRKFVLRSRTIQGQCVSQIDCASHVHIAHDSKIVIYQDDQLHDICVLFCLEIMKGAIDSKVIEKFLRIDPKNYLLSSIKELMVHQNSINLAYPNRANKIPSGLGISTYRGMSLEMYDRLTLMREAFKNNPYITGAQLLRIVVPQLNEEYEKILMGEKTVLARFDKLAKPISPNYNKMPPEKVLIEFDALISGVEELNSCRELLKVGDINAFTRLTSPDQQDVLKYLDCRDISGSDQDKIISYLMKGDTEWRVFTLVHCKMLSDDKIMRILRNSYKTLEVLDLRDSPFTVTNDFLKLLENFQKLREINLSGSMLTKFSDVNLPNLEVLILSRSGQLVKLTNQVIPVGPVNRRENRLAMPKLKVIKADGCISLPSIETDSRTIVDIDVHQSSNLRSVYLSKIEAFLPIRRVDFTGCTSLSNISICFYPLLMRQVERSATFSDEQSIKLASTSISLLVRAKVPLVPETLKKYGISSWKGIRVPGADLSNAYLENLDLEGADLRGANCLNAILKGVNLRGANLKGLILLPPDRRTNEAVSPRFPNPQDKNDQCKGLQLDNCKGLSYENLFILKKQGAQGIPYAEFVPPLSHVVSLNSISIEDIDVCRSFCMSQDSESQERLTSILKFEIEHRFQQYLWTIVLRSKKSSRYSSDASKAISLLNWARVKMNTFALAVLGIEDLQNIKINDADLTYADLSGVDTTGADFSGVQLWGANLTDVNMTKANLDKVYLHKPAGRTFNERDVIRCDGLILDQSKISQDNIEILQKRGNIIIKSLRSKRNDRLSIPIQENQRGANSSLVQYSTTPSPTKSPLQSPRIAQPQSRKYAARGLRVASMDELTLLQVQSPKFSSDLSLETRNATQMTNSPINSILRDDQVMVVDERQILEQELKELREWLNVDAKRQYIAFLQASEREKLEESLEVNKKNLDDINTEIFKLRRMHITTTDHLDIQSKLVQLEQRYQQLMQLHNVLIGKLDQEIRHTEMSKLCEPKPNVFGFYRVFNIKLKELFLGCKTLSGNLCDPSIQLFDSKNTLGKVGFAINLLGNVVNVIPADGNAAKTIMSSAGNIIIQVDQQRMINLIKAFSMFGSFSGIQAVANLLARKLAIRYQDQIESLRTLEEEVKALEMNEYVGSINCKLSTNLKSIDEKTKDVCSVDVIMSPAQLLAEYCILQIFEAIKDNELDPNLPLVTQLFELLTCRLVNKGMLPILGDKISRKFSIDTLVTKKGQEWQMGDIFLLTGVRTQEGDRYTHQDLKPEIFGFCLGSVDEVTDRGLTLLIAPYESDLPILLIPASPASANNSTRVLVPQVTSPESPPESAARSLFQVSGFQAGERKSANINNNNNEKRGDLKSVSAPSLPSVIPRQPRTKELHARPSHHASSDQTSPKNNGDGQGVSATTPPKPKVPAGDYWKAKKLKESAFSLSEGSQAHANRYIGSNVKAKSQRGSLPLAPGSVVNQAAQVTRSKPQTEVVASSGSASPTLLTPASPASVSQTTSLESPREGAARSTRYSPEFFSHEDERKSNNNNNNELGEVPSSRSASSQFSMSPPKKALPPTPSQPESSAQTSPRNSGGGQVVSATTPTRPPARSGRKQPIAKGPALSSSSLSDVSTTTINDNTDPNERIVSPRRGLPQIPPFKSAVNQAAPVIPSKPQPDESLQDDNFSPKPQ